MSHISELCALVSDLAQEGPEAPLRAFGVSEERRRFVDEHRAYGLGIDLTSKCYGSCLYCFARSDESTDLIIPTEKVLGLIDEARDLGMKEVIFSGGDPLLHPDWYKIMSYAADSGLMINLVTSGLLSKKVAKDICKLGIEAVLTNINTINQRVYNQVYRNPSTLEQKIQGHYNLLEAGYPVGRMGTQMTLVKPIIETVEETMDWIVDEVGMKWICIPTFKVRGFGSECGGWEPSLTEVTRVVEYRAKKLGKEWLRFGSSEGAKYMCASFFCVMSNGWVVPCPVIPELAVGNVYEESLKEIYGKHKDDLIFNFELKGACGTCVNKDVCMGCRATAQSYLGDVQASDPKCFLNPEAPEYVLSTN